MQFISCTISWNILESFLESNLQEIAPENSLVNYGRGRFRLRFHKEAKISIFEQNLRGFSNLLSGN